MVFTKKVQPKHSLLKRDRNHFYDFGLFFEKLVAKKLHGRRMAAGKIKETKFIDLMTTFRVLKLTSITGENAAFDRYDIDIVLV